MTRIITATILPSQACAMTGSTPWDVGVSGPVSLPISPQPLEHPQPVTTAVEMELPPVLPLNGSRLALRPPQPTLEVEWAEE